MILVIGEILMDRFPNYERIGGAPFNFAFHLKQMGWPVRFLTRIGTDADGRRIFEMLQSSGFSSEDIQIDPRHATGVVDVTLDQAGVPQFGIRTEAAYDFIELAPVKDVDFSALELVYFGSLAQRTDLGFRRYQQFLAKTNRQVCGFCDINLRPPHINGEAVQSCLRHADILKLNLEELFHISRLYNGPEDEGEALTWLMRTYHIDRVVLTMGSQGSKVVTAQETITSPPASGTGIVDTVGAGDAYAAVFAAGYLKGLPAKLTLQLASDFAAHICGLPGALPSDDAFYKHLRQVMNP